MLVEPEIPQNTGNIARTCAATGAALHLIEPMGFSVDEKHVRRAGLDYWPLVDLHIYSSLSAFFELHDIAKAFYISTKARLSYAQAQFSPDDILVFGKETRGLPESLLRAHPDQCLRIPMRTEARSLNLANSVAIVLYEALRQQGFPELTETGILSDAN